MGTRKLLYAYLYARWELFCAYCYVLKIIIWIHYKLIIISCGQVQ